MCRQLNRPGWIFLVALALGALTAPWVTIAQEADSPRREGRGGGRQRFEDMSEQDREAFRQRMRERRSEFERQRAQRLRASLELSEEEFSVIGTRIEVIQRMSRERGFVAQLGRDDRGGRGGRFGRRFGFDETDWTEHGKKLRTASEALRATLQQSDPSAEKIRADLTAVRSARKEQEAAIAEAREELRGLLTSKQEAMLVMLDVLD